MSKMNLPAYEPLDDQLRMLKGDVSAAQSLKTAVVNATAEGVAIPARVHVKKTAKAILLYVTCVALLLGAVMLLPKWLDAQPPFATQPPVAATRDTLTRPHLSESEKALYHAAWTALKDTVPEDYTINDLLFPDVWIQCGDAFICSFYKWRQTADQTVGVVKDPLTVAGYYFYSGLQFTVFANDSSYKLHYAYARKIISADDVAAFYEVYKEKHPTMASPADEYGNSDTDRDVIANPELLTDIQLEITLATWEKYRGFVYNNSSLDHCSINTVASHMRSCYLYPCGNGYALFVYDFKPAGMMHTDEMIGSYEFRYSSTDTLDYYENGEFMTLAEAYTAGKFSDDALHSVWESYKSNNSLYDRENHVLTNPYVYDSQDPSLDLGALLEGKTCVNGLVDQSTLSANAGFTPKDPDRNGIAALFDGYKTQEDMDAGAGTLWGKVTFDKYTCFFFELTERVQISAYVITTGTQGSYYTDRNPVCWHLYATNDADAAAQMRQSGADYNTLDNSGKWMELDYVWDGGMHAVDLGEHGYVIDADKLGAYRYYCWCIEYTADDEIEVAELELYVEATENSTDRDTLRNPQQYTESEIKAIYAIWDAYKETHREHLTINDVLPSDVSLHGDALVCYDTIGTFWGEALSVDTALDYRFVYPSQQQKRVFANGTVYTFQEAYDAGILTENDIHTLWEEHKERYPTLTEQFA